MRVLHINDALEGGGAEVVFRETCRLLKEKAGINIELFYAKRSVKAEMGDLVDYIFSFKYFFALRKVIKSFKPDIIHLHGFHHYLSPSVLHAVGSLKKSLGYKTVMTVHDYHLLCSNNGYIRWLSSDKPVICEDCNFGRFYRILFNRCDHRGFFVDMIKFLQHFLNYNIFRSSKYIDRIICPSDFIYDKMKRLFSEDKLHVIRNCAFNLEERKNEITEKAGKVRLNFKSIIIGRLSPEKGISDFFENNYSSEKFGDVLVIGNDHLGHKKQIKRILAAKGINNNVFFLPALSHQKVLAYMSKAEYVIFPSIWYENNPLVVIEALSMGKKIFHHDLQTVKEIEALPRDIFTENNYLKELVSFYNKTRTVDAV